MLTDLLRARLPDVDNGQLGQVLRLHLGRSIADSARGHVSGSGTWAHDVASGPAGLSAPSEPGLAGWRAPPGPTIWDSGSGTSASRRSSSAPSRSRKRESALTVSRAGGRVAATCP